ncbi:alanine racemase [Roseiarcaceae bacterium H3SJ34-1]|uniref:alanine racemase n=1 Tax=Terripilifer ovatus TaxID=3032367 RepID=UPI003AB985BF|nr:alanine racemase [Roseiarcaceae bacterium H3SJ34-1]
MTPLPPLTSSMAREHAQATLSVDLDALAANWRLLAEMSAPAECAAVVKADAYGIGIEPAVRALARAGCRTFFVAHVSEGARARLALGVGSPHTIYVLNGILEDAATFAAYVEYGLRPILVSAEQIHAWEAHARTSGRPLPAAVQIDTGMRRLGLDPAAFAEFAGALVRADAAFPLALVMTHFVSSEVRDDPINDHQIARFKKTIALVPGVAASMANSSGIFLPQKPLFDLVRPGYALYGGNPHQDLANPMQPVVRLEAPIIQLHHIEAGETVGYNAQWTAKRPSRLATIGVGYADGIPRNAMATDDHDGGEAIVLGKRCPFAGRVSMDLIIIDVTDVDDPALKAGTPVELLGRDITVDDLAARSKTIGYEILTGLGRRYHRVYRGGT